MRVNDQESERLLIKMVVFDQAEGTGSVCSESVIHMKFIDNVAFSLLPYSFPFLILLVVKRSPTFLI